jgi:hypothetical protein
VGLAILTAAIWVSKTRKSELMIEAGDSATPALEQPTPVT